MIESSRNEAEVEVPPTIATLAWTPSRPLGGTELMVEGLTQRLRSVLGSIELCVNAPPTMNDRPTVVWIHHDINQPDVGWLEDGDKTARVDRFVFVSNWQRQRFIERFRLPADRCYVLRNATDVPTDNRQPARGRPLRLAYASTPYRGLSVLLDAWEMAWGLLKEHDTELNVWSSYKLYGPNEDDTPYTALYARAIALPGVIYHGIVPNDELRRALGTIDILAYPSTFAETSCLIAIEAMAAGCRVICPDLGALAETTAGFAKLYPYRAGSEDHAKLFAARLVEEVLQPWAGTPTTSVEQQQYARATYDWSVRTDQWRGFVADLTGRQAESALPP